MRTNIRKWGNSAGAIIPPAALARYGLKLGESVDVVAEEGKITIKTRTCRADYEQGEGARI
jgi:antitoxin component of MazEF toxin-antitoxin module